MTAIPANFTTNVAKAFLKALRWVEIEGLPYAYGNRAATSALWSSFPAKQQFAELKPYMKEIPAGVDSQADPMKAFASIGEFEFKVIDVEGTLLQSLNVGHEIDDLNKLTLSASSAIGAVTLNVLGDTTNWPAAGTGYIGRTTFSYTGKTANTLTGCTMGMYRSDDVAHNAGEIVTMYPQHLGKRRAWYYLALADDQGAYTGADRFARYGGSITDVDFEDSTTIVLKVQTLERELSEAMLFRDIRSGLVTSALPPASGPYQPANKDDLDDFVWWNTSQGPVDGTGGYRLVFSDGFTSPLGADGRGIIPDEWSYWRIDDEIVLVHAQADGAWIFDQVYRGLFGTKVAPHARKTKISEVYPIGAQDASALAPAEVRYAKFTGGDSPESIFLQLLVSGSAVASGYNTLPESWGAGFDESRVDTSTFVAVNTTHHVNVHLIGYVDRPMKFQEFAEKELLQPWGLKIQSASNDTMKCKYSGPIGILEQTGVPSLGTADFITTPKWEGNLRAVVGMVTMEGDVFDDTPESAKVGVNSDAIRLYRKSHKSVSFRSRFLHERPDAPGGLADFQYVNLQDAFDSRFSYFVGRYGKPPPIVTVTTLYRRLTLDAFDVVYVTLPNLPSMTGTGRGYAGYAEVIGRKIDDRKGQVIFQLLLAGYQGPHYVLLGSSAVVKTWNAGTKEMVCENAADTSFGGTGATGGDCDFFAQNDICVFLSPDFSTVTADVTITLPVDSANRKITFGSAPAGVAAGWYLVRATYGDFDPTPGTPAAREAWMANSSEKLLPINEPVPGCRFMAN